MFVFGHGQPLLLRADRVHDPWCLIEMSCSHPLEAFQGDRLAQVPCHYTQLFVYNETPIHGSRDTGSFRAEHTARCVRVARKIFFKGNKAQSPLQRFHQPLSEGCRHGRVLAPQAFELPTNMVAHYKDLI